MIWYDMIEGEVTLSYVIQKIYYSEKTLFFCWWKNVHKYGLII